jgi:hypothetical protein
MTRSEALLARIDAWKDAGPVRSMVVKVAVTVTGPLLIVVGLAMLVLPGPGLVVMGLGLALLAGEYVWARALLLGAGRFLGQLKQLAFPKGGSPTRKLTGLLATGAAIVGSTLATGAVTTYVGSVLVF